MYHVSQVLDLTQMRVVITDRIPSPPFISFISCLSHIAFIYLTPPDVGLLLGLWLFEGEFDYS